MEPILSAGRAERRGKGLDIGRPREHDLRRIMEAVLYGDRTGIPWRYLPHDFVPWETVDGYFAAWQKDGVFEQLSLFFIYQDLPGLPMALRVSGRLTVLPTS